LHRFPSKIRRILARTDGFLIARNGRITKHRIEHLLFVVHNRVGKKRKGDVKEKPEKLAKVPRAKATKPSKPSKKAAKDPNMPKRPASGFFIFMETFRKTHKEENPDVKGVAEVGKAGGLKWKQMSEEEKAPYNEEALQRKATYEKALAKYNNKGSAKAGEQDVEEEDVSDGSGRSNKSEVQEDDAEEDADDADED
jgi:hypothetical protein